MTFLRLKTFQIVPMSYYSTVFCRSRSEMNSRKKQESTAKFDRATKALVIKFIDNLPAEILDRDMVEGLRQLTVSDCESDLDEIL